MSGRSFQATTSPAPAIESPLVGRYLASNLLLRVVMASSDLLLAPLRLQRPRALVAPRRLLLSIGGHLGDAVIATAAIRQVADALPGVEIGVLMPSWSSVVLEDDSRITHRHTVDHWFLSRRPANLVRKWLAYRRDRRRAVAEIRAVRYDAAVDLYDYFPNSALLLWQARIPIRVGFNAAGFSALYTHVVSWPADQRHTAERQSLLLNELVPGIQAPGNPRTDLPAATASAVERVDALLARSRIARHEFTVVHPGAGSPQKAWPLARWREVAERLSARGEPLVFTGRGTEEHEAIRFLMRDLPRCVDLCDHLEWTELVQLIRLARRVISVDTVVAHVAGAVGTPAATLWTSPSSPHHWRPLGSECVVVGCREPDVVRRLADMTL